MVAKAFSEQFYRILLILSVLTFHGLADPQYGLKPVFCLDPLPEGPFGDGGRWNKEDFTSMNQLCSFNGNPEANFGFMCLLDPPGLPLESQHLTRHHQLRKAFETSLFEARLFNACKEQCGCHPTDDASLSASLNERLQSLERTRRPPFYNVQPFNPIVRPIRPAPRHRRPTSNSGKCMVKQKGSAFYTVGNCRLEAMRNPWSGKRKRDLAEEES